MKNNREVLKSGFRALLEIETDQDRQLPQPPLEKPYDPDGRIIALPEVDRNVLKEADLFACIKKRRSRRKYTGESLTLEELSFLVWATQGVQRVSRRGIATLRTVPSGGARHPFETYLAVNRVVGLERGVYRYLALSHQLLPVFGAENLAEKINEISLGQPFIAEAAVVFIWSCLPYRTEWRYGPAAYKTILLDAGHLCQNLYLACEAIGCGTCAVGAYDQEAADRFLGLDGENEFVIYMAPVGKV